jgi:hypothetical protein
MAVRGERPEFAHRRSTRRGQAERKSTMRQLKRRRGGDLRGTGGRSTAFTRASLR